MKLYTVQQLYDRIRHPLPSGKSLLHEAIDQYAEQTKRYIMFLTDEATKAVAGREYEDKRLRTRYNPLNDPRIML